MKLSCLDAVEDSVTDYLRNTIKHNFLQPDRELALDLSMHEAELLASANPTVQAMAESGDLKSVHNKYNTLSEKIESDYVTTNDQLDRVIT